MPDCQTHAHIRWWIQRDVPSVLGIDSWSYREPWTNEVLLRRARERNCICMVAESGPEVVGFMVYDIHPDRLDVARLAVRPDLRRRGIGTQFLTKLASKLSKSRRCTFTVDVSERDLPAHLFLRSFGLLACGVIRGEGASGEDVYRFRYTLEE